MSTKGSDPVEAAREWAGQDFSKLKTPSKSEQARLLAMLPEVNADESIMVSRSVRLPVELEEQIKHRAEAEGLSTSEWIRNALRRVLAGNGDSGKIDLDAAIDALRHLPHAA
jgi:predicted DNA binding CopG/RHH family protein